MALTPEQRAALKELMDADDERPGLKERLSLHGRLLLSEIAITITADETEPPPTKPKPTGGGDGAVTGAVTGAGGARAPAAAASERKASLHATVENAGVHFGCRPDAYLLDAFWQTAKLEYYLPPNFS